MSYLKDCYYRGHVITDGRYILFKKGRESFSDVYFCWSCSSEYFFGPITLQALEQMAIREEIHNRMNGEERYQTKDGTKMFFAKKRTLTKKQRKDQVQKEERESYSDVVEDGSGDQPVDF